jgi:hypothetical protein
LGKGTKTSKPRGQDATAGDSAAFGAPVGDTPSQDWTEVLADQAMEALWLEGLSPDEEKKQEKAVVDGLKGIAPKDELEGMMAVQLVAAHNASLAAYRRAIEVERSFNMWREAMTQANSLSRTFSTLLDALHRYRGKSQQKITVEHVHRQLDMPGHAHTGGRVSRMILAQDLTQEGVLRDSEEQPHAR